MKDLGKSVHRRDAEIAEKTLRKEVKRIMEEDLKKRREYSLPLYSLCDLCGRCVSAVNWLSNY
jgi:hypothetical protein